MAILIMQNRTKALKQWGIKTNGGIKHAKRSRYTNAWQLCLYKNVHKPVKNRESKQMMGLSMRTGPGTQMIWFIFIRMYVKNNRTIFNKRVLMRSGAAKKSLLD